MTTITKIPKSLIYEEYDGHPIFRKGYRDFMIGQKEIHEINTGNNILQSFIIATIVSHFNKIQDGKYFAFGSELVLNISQNSNFESDITIYEKKDLKINLKSLNHSNIPPKVIIQIDLKTEETEYYSRKTEKLLEWGVEKVIWVFSKSKRILVADNLKTWSFNSWDLPIIIVENYEINLWEAMLANGFEVE